MFETSNLFVLMQSKDKNRHVEVRRIALDEETRKNVVAMFDDGAHSLIELPDGPSKIERQFYSDYSIQPDEDEYMVISGFQIPEKIRQGIVNPASLSLYEPKKDNLPLIRALFVGETDGDDIKAAFQRFRSSQYLKASNMHLFYDRDTLTSGEKLLWNHKNGRIGITIYSGVDVIFDCASLKFVSSFYARQIFDLTDYYKEASKPELESFVSLNGIIVENSDYIINDSNSWERRKIASILSARIIEEHPLEELLEAAKTIDYDLPTAQGKLIIPDDRQTRRQLLSFLDENVYRGMITGSVYETNSKRTR